MRGTAVRAQSRRIGVIVLAGPAVVGGIVAAVGWFAVNTWPMAQTTTLVNWLVQIFVISAGLCVAVVVTNDPLIELHESTPMGFRIVQLLRAGLVILSALLGSVLMFCPLHTLGVWPNDQGWVSVVSPAGAVLIIAIIAVVAAAFAGTASATTIAVVASWMFLAMLWDPYVLPLSLQRGVPLVIAALFLVAAWYRLGNAERNIAKVAVV